jgi:hypothetical protein
VRSGAATPSLSLSFSRARATPSTGTPREPADAYGPRSPGPLPGGIRFRRLRPRTPRVTGDRTTAPPGPRSGSRGKKKIIFKLDAAAATDAYDACLHRPWAPGSPEEEKNFRPGRGAALRGRPPGYRATRGENQISPSACRARRGTGEPTTAPPGPRSGSEKKKKNYFSSRVRAVDRRERRVPRPTAGVRSAGGEKKFFGPSGRRRHGARRSRFPRETSPGPRSESEKKKNYFSSRVRAVDRCVRRVLRLSVGFRSAGEEKIFFDPAEGQRSAGDAIRPPGKRDGRSAVSG